MKYIKTFLPLAIISTLFVAMTRCKKSDTAAAPQKTVPVKLAEVRRAMIALPIHGSGTLFAPQQIRLSFKTGGIVERINVREGEDVRKGQVLAQLNLDEIDAQVGQAQSAYDKANRDDERITNLYAEGVVTLEQKQNVNTQLEVAAANLRIAQFNLEHSTITAPADGKILRRFVEPNELVGPGTPVFYFGSGREEWLVRIGVPDRDIIKIRLGDPALVTFDVYPEVEFHARVTGIAQAADPQNGTFEVEIALDAGGHRLAAGFVGRVVITPEEKIESTLIPAAALVDAHGDVGAVFTVVGDRAVKVPVRIGAIYEESIIVLAGLDGHEKVVAAGAPYLKTGDEVKVQ
ncbi:efflux RND transporter periplasmic adaptor subunit [candidate division KSB1 bacterium]|nr:efflux RND transporter periplasmic adaptor subunit [candidate division KSB1 bacterium]